MEVIKIARKNNKLKIDITNIFKTDEINKKIEINLNNESSNRAITEIDSPDELEKRKPLTAVEWAEKYRFIKGRPMRFDTRMFQTFILNDDSKEMVVKKAAQLGLSEIMLTKLFYFADYNPVRTNVIYTFPTFSDMQVYSTARIQTIIDDAPKITPEDYGWKDQYGREGCFPPTYINTLVRDANNAQLKKIRNTFILFKGTMGARSAQSIDADYLIHDEVDFSDQANLEQYKARVGASLNPHKFYFSTPTIPGYGISDKYSQSDQKRWYVSCGHCGTKQHLTYKEHIKEQGHREDDPSKINYVYKCEHCQLEITKEMIAAGTFIAEYPDKDISGYHISKILTKTANELVDNKYSYRFEKDFYNFDLGLEYTEKNISLTPDIVKDCMNDDIYFLTTKKKNDFVSMGVDQGDTLWVVISRQRDFYYKEIIYMEELRMTDTEDSFKKVEELFLRYFVDCCVIDMNPNKHNVMALAKKYPDKIFAATYAAVKNKIIYFQDEGVVNIDRTQQFNISMRRVADKKVILPSGTQIGETYAQHLCNLKRENQMDMRTGEEKQFWVRIGSDHLAHANLYDDVAREYIEANLNLHGGSFNSFKAAVEGNKHKIRYARSGLGGIEKIPNVPTRIKYNK